MEAHKITYRVIFDDDQEDFFFDINLDPDTLEYIPKTEDRPEWTKLENQKCTGCPLKSETTPYCPVSTNLHQLVASFAHFKSFTQVNVEVITELRTYSKRTDIQYVLLSLFGLIMAGSPCPKLDFFRPLIKFHLPFASTEETMFRTSSMFLLANYFMGNQKDNAETILQRLNDKYADIEQVNVGMLNRIRHVVPDDAGKNAFVGLNLFAQFFAMEFDENLDTLAYLFNTYKKD